MNSKVLNTGMAMNFADDYASACHYIYHPCKTCKAVAKQANDHCRKPSQFCTEGKIQKTRLQWFGFCGSIRKNL
jgi:hypothetical protein